MSKLVMVYQVKDRQYGLPYSEHNHIVPFGTISMNEDRYTVQTGRYKNTDYTNMSKLRHDYGSYFKSTITFKYRE